MMKYVLAGIVGYLIGNIQFAVIISRIKYHDDVRNYGSGNAGSTNMLRVYGPKPGASTFVGDFMKGIIGVLVGRLLAGEVGGYVAGLCVVLGHCYPAFFRFKGGKGVASTFAIVWMIKPLYGAIITAVVLAILFATHTISIMSMTGATLFLLLVVSFDFSNTPLVVTAILLWAFILLRHWENIQRLIKGEESKVLVKKSRDLK